MCGSDAMMQNGRPPMEDGGALARARWLAGAAAGLAAATAADMDVPAQGRHVPALPGGDGHAGGQGAMSQGGRHASVLRMAGRAGSEEPPVEGNASWQSMEATLREALREAVSVIEDYLSYRHDGDPTREDARTMGEMEIDDYGRDGRLAAAVGLIGTTRSDEPEGIRQGGEGEAPDAGHEGTEPLTNAQFVGYASRLAQWAAAASAETAQAFFLNGPAEPIGRTAAMGLIDRLREALAHMERRVPR